jgi:predicted GIY-YIG superfamily endonuclease
MEALQELVGPSEPPGSDRQAVYRCFGTDGQLLYIGTTGKLGRRFASHAQKIWFLEVRGITLEWYPDEESALEAEAAAILAEQPKYNIIHKGPPKIMRPADGPLRLPSLQERRAAFASALDDALEGLPPRDIKAACGLGRTYVHQLLDGLIESGAVIRAARGLYRKADPASDVSAAIATLVRREQAGAE